MSDKDKNDQDKRAYGPDVQLRPDGKTDNFFGSYGKPDGKEHGHAVVKPDGTVVYAKDVTQNVSDLDTVIINIRDDYDDYDDDDYYDDYDDDDYYDDYDDDGYYYDDDDDDDD